MVMSAAVSEGLVVVSRASCEGLLVSRAVGEYSCW